MRTAGTVVAGGVSTQSRPLPTEPREIDLDAVRERREAEKARQAARNPFSRLGPGPKAADARRAALVDDDYTEHAFTTPPPEDTDLDEGAELDDETPADEPATALAATQTPQGAAPSGDTFPSGVGAPSVAVEVEGEAAGTAAEHPRPAGTTTEEVPVTTTPKPVPKPGPTFETFQRPTGNRGGGRKPVNPVDPAGIVREYVEDRLTIQAIAARRGHSAGLVRRVLTETPGIQLRNDRAGRGGQNKVEVTPELAADVRRLYQDEGYSIAEVAHNLKRSQRVVRRVMAEHGIKARPKGIRPAQKPATVARESVAVAYPQPDDTKADFALAPTPAAADDSKALAEIQDAALADQPAGVELDDVDAHLSALTAAVTVRGALERAGESTTVLDTALRASTRRLDEAANHGATTLRLLQAGAC